MLDRRWKIYAYINKVNGKLYIGQTCRTLKERSGKNGALYKQCPLFSKAINKYGWDNFKPIILFENLTREEANILEIELINKYQTTNSKYGYNVSKGGNDNTYSSIDITNERFGHLVALELCENNKVGRYWLCQCDCGNICVVRQDHLRNGTTKACIKCGCATHKIQSNDYCIIKDGNIKVLMANDYYFIIDKSGYEKIKLLHWYFDKNNIRIVDGANEKNVIYSLFPEFKRKRILKWIRYKDGNIFNLCANNLYINPPNGVTKEEWNEYLSDDNQICFISSNKRRWKNKITNKLYFSYTDAKNDYQEENHEY